MSFLNNSKKNNWFGSKSFSVILIVVIVAVFCLVNFLNINDYGQTWDEDLHYRSGEQNRNIFQGESHIEEIELFGNMRFYGPLGDMIGDIFWELFTKRLGVLFFVPAHHIHLILFGAVTLMTVFFLARVTLGLRAAVFSAVFLMAFPRFIGDMQVNMKATPLVALFTLTIFLFYLAVKRRRAWLFLLSGITFGLAFAVGISVLFVLPILAVWFLLAFRERIWGFFKSFGENKRKVWSGFKQWGWGLLSLPFVAFGTAAAFWPWVWSNPIFRMLEAIREVGGYEWLGNVWYQGVVYKSVDLPWHYAPFMLFVVTPVIIIVFGGMGTFVACRNVKTLANDGSILYLVWFWLPLVLIVILHINVYDGIRHFVFIVPALALLAGMGADWLYRFIGEKTLIKTWRRWLYVVLTIVIVFFTGRVFYQMAVIHPYELYYFNDLIGGMRGAYRYVEVGYWGQEFKQGAEWVNGHIEEGAKIAVMPTPKMAENYLRPDIKLIRENENDPNYVIYVTKAAYDPFKGGKVIYTLLVDGAPLLRVKEISN
ncbi:MAG: hypothetical protein ACD_63C00070G0015 [uncultured bacterium]|nr:MAG: hypothetical protein ACD_63C00070G0015 [uncultured bacterium]